MKPANIMVFGMMLASLSQTQASASPEDVLHTAGQELHEASIQNMNDVLLLTDAGEEEE